MVFTEPATAHRRYIYWVARTWLVREHARTIDEPSSMAPRWLALSILKCEPLTIHLTDGTWLALREPQPSHLFAGLAVEYGWFSWGHLPNNLGWRLGYFVPEYLYLNAVRSCLIRAFRFVSQCDPRTLRWLVSILRGSQSTNCNAWPLPLEPEALPAL